MKWLPVRGIAGLICALPLMAAAQSPKSAPVAVKDAPAPVTEETEFPKSRLPELYSLIDEIKIRNPPQNYRFRVQTGIIQMLTNTDERKGVRAGNGIGFPAIGIETVANIWNHIGVLGRFVYAQNLLPSQDSLNGTNAFIYWADVGPRYTLYFDSTRIDDYLAFQVLFHLNESNLQIYDKSSTSVFMTRYFGVSGSVERSIPITRKLGVSATFDLLQILDSSSPSNQSLQKSGYGFQIQGEIYYQLNIFERFVRVGLSYWQQGNEVEAGEEIKVLEGKNSFFQLGRALFLNLSALY
jgi:hypothetical protein